MKKHYFYTLWNNTYPNTKENSFSYFRKKSNAIEELKNKKKKILKEARESELFFLVIEDTKERFEIDIFNKDKTIYIKEELFIGADYFND